MSTNTLDGTVQSQERCGDLAAIKELAIAYAYAVDDRDWKRWRSLFTDDAQIDYLSAGGIAGSADELAAWMPDAMSIFKFCMHSVLTHEVKFTGDETATGRAHVFNRNGVVQNGVNEFVDVGAIYEDTYVRAGGVWKIASRTEHVKYITGGSFADMIREGAGDASGIAPFG